MRQWITLCETKKIVTPDAIDTRDRLGALLLAVRHKLIHDRTSNYGDCELVAEEFLSYARGEGLVMVDPNNPHEGEGEVVLGYRAYDEAWCKRFKGYVPEPGQHQWVEINGMIYDGTADQFGERKHEVFVTAASDPRYRVHQRSSHSFMRATRFPSSY